MPFPLHEIAFDRILLIKPSSLGDIIHALPVLHGLRRRYPGARIDWLVARPFVSLLDGHPELTEVIPFDRARFGRMATRPAAVGDFAQFIRDLRRRRYELVIDLQGLFRSGFLAWSTGAGTRVGLAEAREGAPLWYTHRLPAPRGDVHAVDRNFMVGELLGFSDAPVRFDLGLSPADRTNGIALLGGVGVHRDGRPTILVAPGARWETKQWPAAHWVDLIDRLQRQDRAQCVLVGSPTEAAFSALLADSCRPKPFDLTGQTTPRQLAAVVEVADLVVALDSATIHLAAALERPLLCLTGPTNPARTGPYRRPFDVLRLDLPCSPCYLRRLSQCAYGHECMNGLSPERVFEALLTWLELRT